MAASTPATALIVFAIVYAAIAVGHLPGRQVDREPAPLWSALWLWLRPARSIRKAPGTRSTTAPSGFCSG
jgi:hypothetical protein